MEKQPIDSLSFAVNHVAKIFSGKLGFYTRETLVVAAIDAELDNKIGQLTLPTGRQVGC